MRLSSFFPLSQKTQTVCTASHLILSTQPGSTVVIIVYHAQRKKN